ncbi:AraC family transcriptional regulator [Brenneria populi subsp. brevivirga]|uniref:AraC family transcriptional regulator n=1 Tax=Brenneria populi TaxID=1505588 RepID=UPI002E1717D4|nr:AraC family transcriptional regulator [Brenneria populi subsp. brevivirga]
MLSAEIHDNLMSYTDRELEILKTNYQFKHKFTKHMERKFFKDNSIYIEKQTRFAKVPLHSHEFIEVVYIYQGVMRQTINQRAMTLRQGEILLLNQFAKHEIEAAGHDDIIINFIIKIDFFGKLMSLFDEENLVLDFILSSINGKKRCAEHICFKVGEVESIQKIMHVIISEIYSKNNFKEVRVNFLVGLLITELLANSELSDCYINASYNESLSISVLKYIDDNYRTASLKEISNRLKQPNYKISKLLKDFTGKNFSELLIEKRVEVFLHHLKHTDCSIVDIINITGYENASHFYKIFKEKFNMSIKQYREKNM